MAAKFWKDGCEVLERWLRSFQDSPIVREAFSGYDIVSLERPNGIGDGTGNLLQTNQSAHAL